MKIHSGDAIDLKRYEPAMRHLIDTYIRAEDSEVVSSFDDLSLVQLIVERGVKAVEVLQEGMRRNQEAVAETIENNVRKLIIDEQPINPKYYEKMSQLLDALIAQRKLQAVDYQDYLRKVCELAKQVKNGPDAKAYPQAINTAAKQALYDNLDRNEVLAIAIDEAVRASRQDDWRNNPMKIKKVRLAIKGVLETNPIQAIPATSSRTELDPVKETPPPFGAKGGPSEDLIEQILNLVKSQNEY